jgi:predicted transcriptional regulator of viral defense system
VPFPLTLSKGSQDPFFRHLFVLDEEMEHTSPAMRLETHTQRILALLRQKGIVRPSDLADIGVPRMVLRRMTNSGQLERAGRGLYQLPGRQGSEYEGLTAVATKVPQAVFCLLSALQFHELTTQLPWQVWIAMPRGSHVPKMAYPPVKMVQFSGEAYSEGIEVHERDQVLLRVYCVAKTIADCFKHRHKIGLDVALEALRDARSQKKASADDLWRFAKICRVANVMRPYLEVIG